MEGSIKVNFPPVSLKVNLPFFGRRTVSLQHAYMLLSDSFNGVFREWVSFDFVLIRCRRSTELLTISQQTNLAVDLYCGSQDAITRRNHSIRVDQSDTVFYSRVEHFNDLFPTVLLTL